MKFLFNEETNMLERYEPYKEICIGCDTEEDYNEILEYLEKFTPKKPIHGGDELYNYECCPTCNNIMDNTKYYDYCPYCGQRLDWNNNSK